VAIGTRNYSLGLSLDNHRPRRGPSLSVPRHSNASRKQELLAVWILTVAQSSNDLNGLHGLEPGILGRGVNAGILRAGFGPVQPTHP
jgi:hypothetical protein